MEARPQKPRGIAFAYLQNAGRYNASFEYISRGPVKTKTMSFTSGGVKWQKYIIPEVLKSLP